MTPGQSTRRNWKGLIVNLTLSVASAVLFLGALEGLARLGGQRPCASLAAPNAETPLDKVRANPARIYELVPGSIFTFTREAGERHALSAADLDAWEQVTYHINALGLRGPEASLSKPPNTLRVVVMGDSVGFGWGLEEGDTLSSQLQERLNQDAGAHTYQVWNAGVPGFATWQELSYLNEKGSQWQPDVVLIPFLFNDVDGNTEGAQKQPFGMGTAGQMLTTWTQKSALLCFLRNQALGFRLKYLHPCQGPNCWTATEVILDGLVAQCGKLGCRLVMIAFPLRLQVEPGAEPGYYDRALGENSRVGYQDIIEQLCRSRGIAYLDLLPAFGRARTPGQGSLFLDPDHPNALGSHVAGEAMYQFLKELGI